MTKHLIVLILALAGGLAVSHAQTISCGGMFGFGGMIQTPCPAGGGGGGGSDLFLEDGSSFLLLEDGTSKLCLESGC